MADLAIRFEIPPTNNSLIKDIITNFVDSVVRKLKEINCNTQVIKITYSLTIILNFKILTEDKNMMDIINEAQQVGELIKVLDLDCMTQYEIPFYDPEEHYFGSDDDEVLENILFVKRQIFPEIKLFSL